MRPINSLELFFLTLVVIHAIQHLPHDICEARRQIRNRFEKIFGRGKSRLLDTALEALVILGTAVAVSPMAYYGLEWLAHARHSLTA
jgi:hypothetical protein